VITVLLAPEGAAVAVAGASRHVTHAEGGKPSNKKPYPFLQPALFNPNYDRDVGNFVGTK